MKRRSRSKEIFGRLFFAVGVLTIFSMIAIAPATYAQTWTRVDTGVFGAGNTSVSPTVVFGGHLYAGTLDAPPLVAGGQIWRLAAPIPDRFFSCFIATAAFGTPMAEEVEVLRRFRDRYLLTNELGRRFVSLYYQHSPALAEYISEREWAKRLARIALSPLVRIVEFIVGE